MISKIYMAILAVIAGWGVYRTIEFSVNRVRISKAGVGKDNFRSCTFAAKALERYSFLALILTLLLAFQGMASALNGRFIFGESKTPGYVLILGSIVQFLDVALIGLLTSLIFYLVQWV